MSVSAILPRVGSARGEAISPSDFSLISDLVRTRSGIVLGLEKAYLVESRLDQIVRSGRFKNLSEIAARLRSGLDEALSRDVTEALTTNETLFFRDTKPFEHLGRHVLPILHSKLPPGQKLRIWSAASSSGQEAYSIAMTVQDAGIGTRPVQILGTDISDLQVSRARLGVYSDFEIQRGLPPEKLARYFIKTEGGWRVGDAARRMVEFRRWNLIEDLRPLGTFDVVFCRNVLIYFDMPTKRRVLEAIWERLSPGGLLYLGGAETIFGVSDRYVPCPGSQQVYAAVLA
jgi:chemotaxis protein methyltransferase CheR